MKFTPDRTKLKDTMGRYRTQSLFLEFFYDDETAIYSLADEDKTREGKVFPSLKRLYMECNDPTEYTFAVKYLWGWDHWLALQGNSAIMKYIEQWREELEVKLRSDGIKSVLNKVGDSFNAAKWAADGGWDVKRGRPSKEELKREQAKRTKIMKTAEEDSDRIFHLIKKDGTKDG